MNITKFLLVMFSKRNTFDIMFGIFDHIEFNINGVLNHPCQNTQYQKQPREVFSTKGVLKNFAKLTRKHHRLFFNKGIRGTYSISNDTFVTGKTDFANVSNRYFCAKKSLISFATRFSWFYSLFSLHTILNAI